MDGINLPLASMNIRALFLVWGFPQGAHRSQFMAELLGMDIEHVFFTPKRGRSSAFLKYPVQAMKTLFVLAHRRPQVVFVQNPPIFAPLIVYLWGLVGGTKLIIDSHTDALLASWWEWSLPLHRFLSRRAIVTLVTNDYLRQMIAEWGANALTLTDVPAIPSRRQQSRQSNDSFNILYVSTASYDEPISEVLEAASRLPEVCFRITGNYQNNAQHIIQSAPANVHFTGYVPDEEFFALFEAAHAVMCLTTENHTMQSGASEALWSAKPIITSNWPMLRDYFDQGTLHVDNTADGIVQAVATMRENLPAFEVGIKALQAKRRDEWSRKVEELIQQIREALNS